MIAEKFESLLKISPIKYKKNLSLLVNHLKILDKYMEEENPMGYKYYSYNDSVKVKSQLKIAQGICSDILNSYKSILEVEYGYMTGKGWTSPHHEDIESFFDHVSDLMEIELSGEEEIEEGNLFLGIEEKMKRANESAKSNNKEGLFSNLHTVFEILLKDKLGIALDMDGAKLGKVIRICLEKKVFNGKESILRQISKDICDVDNKIKHSGYDPKPKEINDALLIGQQGVRVLKNEIPNLDDSVKEEISKILIKNN